MVPPPTLELFSKSGDDIKTAPFGAVFLLFYLLKSGQEKTIRVRFGRGPLLMVNQLKIRMFL